MEDNKDKEKGKKGKKPKKQAKQDKLMVSSNSMYSELRDVRWLYNPVVYSQLSGDFTLMQQRILVGIIEKLQQRIIDSVDVQHKEKSFPAIFEDSELMNQDTIDLNISAADLGVIPAHYDQLEQAATALSSITMKYPIYDSKGRVSRHVAASLFPRIEIAHTESELRRTGILRVVMLTENIRDIFTMQHGFVKHVSHIARIALKKRTPRLYIYLSRFKEIGHKKVPYKDLVEFLGLTDEYYYETNIGSNPYTSWAKVKQLVLEPVKQEMDELAAAGEINFSFEYEPIFPNGKTRGIPDEVLFKMKNSSMGEQKAAEDYRTNSIYNFIDTYVAWCPDLSIHALQELVKNMNDDTLKHFIDFAFNDVRRIVERKQPDDVASYVMGILRKWKREHLHPVQQTLFDEEKPKEPEKPAEIPGQYADEWKTILSRYNGILKPYLLKARHFGTSRGFILIYFPSQQLLDEFNKEEPNDKNVLRDLMKEVLGMSGYILVRGLDPAVKK